MKASIAALALGAFSFLPGPCRAQGAPAEETPVARFAATVDVGEVTLGVRVVDGSGRPIRDLRADELVLVVDGVPTPITSFSPPSAGSTPEAAGAAAPPDESLHLTLLVNDRGGSARDRSRALRQLVEAAPGLQARGWRIEIAAIDSAYHTVHAFTDDPSLVVPRLQELEAVKVHPSAFAAERQNLLTGMDDISIGEPGKGGGSGIAFDSDEARGILERIRALARGQRQLGHGMIGVLGAVVTQLGRLPGTRCLIYLGEGFEAQPASDLFLMWEGRYPQVALGQLRRPTLEVGDYSLASEVADLREAATAADVTVYYVPTAAWAGGAAPDVDRETAEVTSDLPAAVRRSLGDGVRSLALASGGGVIDPARRGLVELAADLGARYTITFAAPDSAAAVDHRVELSVSRRGARARYRRSFRAISIAERMARATVTALASGGGANPLEAAVEVQDSTPRADGGVDLSVAVTVPMRRLALLPEHAVHRADVTIYFAAGGGTGQPVEVRSRMFPVVLDNASLIGALERGAAFTLDVAVPAGAARLAVTVLDNVSHTSSSVAVAVGTDGADR
jgi:VWFA-related protein